MELRLITPDLRRLDQATTEVLAISLPSDGRPPRGTAGLVDWRLAGALSRLMKHGFVSGRLEEVVLLPGRPKLPFEKVLLFGIGAEPEFDEGVFRLTISKMLDVFEGLKARTAVVDLPGRRFDGITPERALALVFSLSQDRPSQDLWTLIEKAEAHKAINEQLLRERRRAK